MALKSKKLETSVNVLRQYGTHLIHFPKFWRKQWDTLYYTVSVIGKNTIKIEKSTEELGDKMYVIDKSFYFILDSKIIKTMMYSDFLKMKIHRMLNSDDDYFEITIPTDHLDQARYNYARIIKKEADALLMKKQQEAL